MRILNEILGIKKVVFTFGRTNPPTSGHSVVFSKVLSYAQSQNADAKIFVSQTQDSKKNPLSWREKVKYIKLGFPAISKHIVTEQIITPFAAVRWLIDQGYTDVTMVVGQDRVSNFKSQIGAYVNHRDPEKSLKLKKFSVISAGDRDPDSDDVTGMSASKMRKAAEDGDFKSFLRGCMSNLSPLYAKEMFNAVRRGLRINKLSEMVEQVFLNRCSDDLSVKRSEMPQFNKSDKKEFFRMIMDGNVLVTIKEIPVGSLKPTQTDYDEEKVKDIMRSTLSTEPIIVSSDNYIVDGHHRWLASCWLFDKASIKAFVVELPIIKLLELANSFLEDEVQITEEFLRGISL